MHRLYVFLGVTVFLFAIGLGVLVPTVFAHAEPESCTPPIGGTVDKPPEKLVCKTTEGIVPNESKLQVFDSSGNQVDKGDSSVDLNDPDRVTISVSLDTSKMSDGVYTVKWVTVSAEDNDEDSGEFTFVVASTSAAQATVTPQPQATATPVEATAEATPAPTPTQTAAPLPTTGAASTHNGFALAALLGLLALGAGMLLRAKR